MNIHKLKTGMNMRSEVAERADFSNVRYAQCWEDADVLLHALDVQPGDVCLSVASAGDNTLALLTRAPSRVVAIDLNPTQLACLELRVAGYRELEHEELLQLVGSRACRDREALYRRCRRLLSPAVRTFWDKRGVAEGIGAVGKFEHYFKIFRERVLPWVHSPETIGRLLEGGSEEARRMFYETRWNTWRWKWMFRIFFSRWVMGRMGRDPSFFAYAEGPVADRILERARYALTELNPAENPYLHWILTGTHSSVLPVALRAESFSTIRDHLDCLEWHCQSMEDYLESAKGVRFDRFNLSDIFEYMSPDHYRELLERLLDRANPLARLAYWNTLVPRSRPEAMNDRLKSLEELSRSLHAQDKAFFYCKFVVEEVVGTPARDCGSSDENEGEAAVWGGADRLPHVVRRDLRVLPVQLPGELARHKPDGHWIVSDSTETTVGQCSLWWQNTPEHAGRRVGIVGHYKATDLAVATVLLKHACEELTRQGCEIAVGPMDGSTWRQYRLITWRGAEPVFFLEPDNPGDWPDHFLKNDFQVMARYFSALNGDLAHADERALRTEERLERIGVKIRSIRMDDFQREVQRIYEVSLASFQRGFLFAPIGEEEFQEQCLCLRERIRPELILLAEQEGRSIGFLFGIPDWLQTKQGGQVDTAIIKSLGIVPERAFAGLGSVLVARLHEVAREVGYRRCIHALMHEGNRSRNISARTARVIRGYALFGRRLDCGR